MKKIRILFLDVLFAGPLFSGGDKFEAPDNTSSAYEDKFINLSY